MFQARDFTDGVDPAVVEELRSNPVAAIRNAKQGSMKDLLAIVDNVNVVPSTHTLDAVKMLCANFAPDPTQIIAAGMGKAATNFLAIMASFRGLSLFSKKYSTHPSLGPIVVKSWLDIEKWLLFLRLCKKEQDITMDDDGGDTMSLHIAFFLEGVLRCKDDPSRSFFQKHVPILVAALWSQATRDEDNWPFAMTILGYCLQAADDPSFLKNFLMKVQKSEAEFIKILIQHGKSLSLQSPVDYDYTGSFLESMCHIVFTLLRDPLMMGGGCDMVLDLFSTLPKSPRVTAGWLLALGSCLQLFEATLSAKTGYMFLVKMIKGNFLNVLISCSPNFPRLDAEKQEICKRFVSKRIPSYFHVYPVLKHMLTAMERISISKRNKLRHSIIAEQWVALENILLERLVLKALYDVRYKGKGGEMCMGCKKVTPLNALHKCSRCHQVLYCSKDCQKDDWSQGGHRNDCKELAIMDEHDYLGMHVVREFISVLVSIEVNRHLPGLRNLLKSNLPGKSFSQAMIVVTMSSPVEMNVTSSKDLEAAAPSDGKGSSERRFNLFAQAASKDTSSSDEAEPQTWVQVILPEGESQAIHVQQSRLLNDMHTVQLTGRIIALHRTQAVDTKGRTLATRRDEVDDTLQYLSFERVEELYYSGSGATNQLSDKLKSAVSKSQSINSQLERFAGDSNKLE